VTTLEITRQTLRRFVRDRTAMFFVVVLPVMIIVVLGTTLGGFGQFRVAVVDLDRGALTRGLVDDLTSSRAFRAQRFAGVEGAARSVRRSENVLAIVIPADTSASLRDGRSVEVQIVGDPTSSTYAAASAAVSAAIADQGATLQAATFVSDRLGGTVAGRLDGVTRTRRALRSIQVDSRAVDTVRRVLPEGFSYSAPTMLVLFVFINAMAAGAAVIENRKLRLYERMLAAPVRPATIIVGETIAYFAIALVQSLLIVAVGAIAFGVSWGDPVAAMLLIGSWALVGTGAGILSGTLFRTPEQASSIGPAIGMALGMLGGCMWPLEIVAAPMRAAGHVVPHAWAVDAWTVLLSRSGGVSDIGGDLLVLGAFAVTLISIATWRLSRRIV
jgi:ABC-2 type transport system permease protein